MTVLGLDAWCAVEGETKDVSAPTAGDIVSALDRAPSGDVLLIAGGADTVRAARIAVSSLRRSDVALIEITGPPTRRHAVRLGLELLWPEAYGFADAVIGAIDGLCATQVLLSSVTRLTDPNPTLIDHVASWIPGQYFAVDIDGRRVRRTSEPKLALERGDVAVLSAQWNRPDEVEIAPLPAFRIELTGPPASAPWRARRWTEVTVVRGSLIDTLQRSLAGSRPRACPSCPRAVTGVRCRFCGIVVPSKTEPAAARPAVVPTASSEETFA